MFGNNFSRGVSFRSMIHFLPNRLSPVNAVTRSAAATLMPGPPVVELWFILNNISELALSIPLDKCLALSVNPLKWLRFLGYSIYGKEGYLSMSATDPPINNYSAVIAACPYYFLSEGKLECSSMFFSDVVFRGTLLR